MDLRHGPLHPKRDTREPESPEESGSSSRLPKLLENQKRLALLVFGAAAAVVLLFAIIWYAVGLPGAPASFRRALGRLPEAGERGFLPVHERSPEPRSLIAGLPCGDSYKRRPIAVMLGSDPVARPLSGMAQADLVFELPALLNNVTRQMAVYQCGQPSEIGGVRSARHDYLFLAKGLDAVIAHWGGSYHALNRIRSERQGRIPVYESIDALRNPENAYYRIARLRAPYNGYTTYDRLWGALRALGYRTYSVFPGYPHREELPRGQRGAGTLDVGWPGSMRVRYVYNPETNAYDRFWGGERHLDGLDNVPVRPRSLVVLYTEQRPAKGPGGYNDVDVEGSGRAQFLQNGQVLEGTWEKNEVHKQDPLVFKTALGQPFEFIPGQIWIHIVDGRTPVSWIPGPVVPPELSAGSTPTNLGE